MLQAVYSYLVNGRDALVVPTKCRAGYEGNPGECKLVGHGWYKFWALHPTLPVFVWTPLWLCQTHAQIKHHYVHQLCGPCQASFTHAAVLIFLLWQSEFKGKGYRKVGSSVFAASSSPVGLRSVRFTQEFFNHLIISLLHDPNVKSFHDRLHAEYLAQLSAAEAKYRLHVNAGQTMSLLPNNEFPPLAASDQANHADPDAVWLTILCVLIGTLRRMRGRKSVIRVSSMNDLDRPTSANCSPIFGAMCNEHAAGARFRHSTTCGSIFRATNKSRSISKVIGCTRVRTVLIHAQPCCSGFRTGVCLPTAHSSWRRKAECLCSLRRLCWLCPRPAGPVREAQSWC
jgi:hypothetical protein